MLLTSSAKSKTLLLWLLFSLVLSEVTKGQSYFKTFDSPDIFFNQKLERFANGDLLIGDSSQESLRNGGINPNIILTRVDDCGNVIWSFSHAIEEGHFEFKDLKINDQEEIFVYGSYYIDLRELIFLLKVDGQTGDSKEYKLYRPGTVDHFTYSMALHNDQIMLYGLVFDFNSLKEGFIALFDEALNFQWAKTYTPFESNGFANVSSDNGFVGHSANFLLKTDALGNLQWGLTYNDNTTSQTLGGPFEHGGGFLFEVHQEGFNFFYKVSLDGQLQWVSDKFPSTPNRSALSLLNDGNILATYSCLLADESTPICQLVLNAQGQILEQRELMIEEKLANGTIYQSINPATNNITLTGNKNPFYTESVDVKDFIFQFPLDSLMGECLFWEPFQNTTPNSNTIELLETNYAIEDQIMELDEIIPSKVSDTPRELTDICDFTPLEFTQKDTLIDCGATWEAYLPANNYYWVDGVIDNPRILSEPGTYVAKKISCTNPLAVEYTLQTPECGCNVFLPNAISPNGDNINDELQFYTDCPLENFEIKVFDRWGQLVFQSKSIENFWKGKYLNKDLPLGVYVAAINYEWINQNGESENELLVQDVTLLR